MSDYLLTSTWAEVDAAAQAVKNGLPKANLSGAVQASLEKADGAVQVGDQATKTPSMTQAVGVDLQGKLWTVPGGGGGGDAEVFWITITASGGSYVMDCTWADIADAMSNGMLIVAKFGDRRYWWNGDPTDDGLQLVSVDVSSSSKAYAQAFTISDNGTISRKSNVSLNPSDLWLNTLSLSSSEKAKACDNIGAISASDIGTVFTLKGSVAAVADLPSTGNTVGDVYYVEAVSAGYIWLTSTTYPNGYWEELGETIDLSAYEEKPTVVQVSGNTPTIALAQDNTIYELTGAAITSVTITARDSGAAFAVIFDTPAGSTPPTFTYPTVNMYMPDNFSLDVYRHYEINVDSKGFAAVGSWSFD